MALSIDLSNIYNAFTDKGSVQQDPLQGYQYDASTNSYYKKGHPTIDENHPDFQKLNDYTDNTGNTRDPNLYKPITGFFPRLFNPSNISYVDKANTQYANEPLQALDANNTRLAVDENTISRAPKNFFPDGIGGRGLASLNMANLRPSQLQQEGVAAGNLQGGITAPLSQGDLITAAAGVDKAKTEAQKYATDVGQNYGQMESFANAAVAEDTRQNAFQNLANAPQRQRLYNASTEDAIDNLTTLAPLRRANDIYQEQSS